jgi:Carboxypeptidase regulatory-like domain
MIVRLSRSVLAACLIALWVSAVPASAQITTGTVVGNVKDTTGGVVPGATVVLISEARGTRSVPAITNATGDYVFPNITPDTYTVEVTMDGFRTVKRAGVSVSGADRVAVPALTLEPGGAEETVTVTSEAPLIQASSGERSFAISQVQIENLPVNHLGGGFTNYTSFTPGVIAGGASAGGTRLGGVGQNNIMMDGISAMDTGNNGQMLNMNVESIAEVKVLTQGYQAEYGRSSGLQITAVTKSGTNRFRGSAYDYKINSDWNENSWVNQKNNDPKPVNKRDIYGYSLGGPVGKPGGNNKVFFFYSHEYRPTNAAINGGNPIRLRVPTLLERAGDFSQTLDQNGALFNFIRDHQTGLACSATNTAGCFRDGGVLGRIPANRLYSTGVAILKRYPEPNIQQAAGTNFNYQINPPAVKDLQQQPAIRLDYQLSSKLRVTGKYSGQRARRLTTPGLIQGFTDVFNPNPFITNYAITANYAMSPTTFMEGTYGFIRNELVGGNEGGVLVNESANRLTSLPDFPMLFPDAGRVDPKYYANEVLNDVNPPWWDGTSINLPPVFAWGNRIGAAPPNQRYPGWLNINRTQDVAISITKIAGRHTIKGGFYNNHSYKAQNVDAGGGLRFQPNVDFGQDTNNPLDAQFGYANAITGIFRQYTQAEKFIEGSMIYNNTEFYIQDNWKVNSRLTMDYGLRFTRQQPQHDQFQQMSNFFPDQWSRSAAPVLYIAGCTNGATVCSGNVRNAMDPRNGQIVLPFGGALNTQILIGTPVPNTGNALNGIRQAGDGIAKTGYTWPTLVVGPRFGAAYDLSGTQSLVLRGGVGLFFDRPDGNTVFSIPGNPPIASSGDLRNSSLASLTGGIRPGPVPQLVTFQYDAKVPASWQWQIGMQMALPWASSLDVSYVGNHGYDRLGGLQGGNVVNLNAVDIGAAFLPQNQDPTLGTSAVPGANAYSDNLLRSFRGLANINQNTTDFWDTYHSIQTSFQRRFQGGFSAGVNYTLGLSLKGNTGLQKRLVHGADGTISLRDDQGEYEKKFENLNLQRHVAKVNAVWDMPDVSMTGGGARRVIGHVINDWQLSGVFTGNSGNRYDLAYSFQSNGANRNLTGSPDYGARIVYVGDPGSGCTDDQYGQFNINSVTAPTTGSVGLESGRNLLIGCPNKVVDISLARNIRLGGGRELRFQVDAFNAFNTVIYNNRQNQIQYETPTDLTVRNPQYLADGTLNPARLQPRNAGFGAATGADNLRNFQAMIRFSF